MQMGSFVARALLLWGINDSGVLLCKIPLLTNLLVFNPSIDLILDCLKPYESPLLYF